MWHIQDYATAREFLRMVRAPAVRIRPEIAAYELVGLVVAVDPSAPRAATST